MTANPFSAASLSRNPVVSSLQLLGWAWFRPSAWSRYTSAMGLHPGFALCELRRSHQRDPHVVRLVMGLALLFILIPLLALIESVVSISNPGLRSIGIGSVATFLVPLCALAMAAAVAATLALFLALTLTMLVAAAVDPSGSTSPFVTGAAAGLFVAFGLPMLSGHASVPVVRRVMGFVIAIPTTLAIVYAATMVPSIVVSYVGFHAYTVRGFLLQPWLIFATVRSSTGMAFATASAAAVGLVWRCRWIQKPIEATDLGLSGVIFALALIQALSFLELQTQIDAINGIAVGTAVAVAVVFALEASGSSWRRSVVRLVLAATAMVLLWVAIGVLSIGLRYFDAARSPEPALLLGGIALGATLITAWLTTRLERWNASKWRLTVTAAWVFSIGLELLLIAIADSRELLETSAAVKSIAGVPIALAAGLTIGGHVPLAGRVRHAFIRPAALAYGAGGAALLTYAVTGNAVFGKDVFLSVVGLPIPHVEVAAAIGIPLAIVSVAPHLLFAKWWGPRLSVGFVAIALGAARLASEWADWKRFAAAIGWTVVGLLVGLTERWWRPVMLYPLLAGYNRVLYELDRSVSPHKSALRWHSAFWDERSRLPPFGLRKHMALLERRNPDEARAAGEALALDGKAMAQDCYFAAQ